MSKDNRKKEFLRLANDRLLDSEARGELLSKLAGGNMDRSFVAKQCGTTRKGYEKHKRMHNDFSSQLNALQGKVDTSLGDMIASRDSMIDFNKILQVMDLIGASQAKKEKCGDCSYFVDGQRMHADTSNYADIILVPWKQRGGDNNKAEDEPLSTDFEDEIDNSMDKKLQFEKYLARKEEDDEEESPDEDEGNLDLVEKMRLSEEDPFAFIEDDSKKMDEDELSERDSIDWEPSDYKDDYYDADMMFDSYDEKVASVESLVIKKVAKRFR